MTFARRLQQRLERLLRDKDVRVDAPMNVKIVVNRGGGSAGASAHQSVHINQPDRRQDDAR